jgi:hypothetical protein
MKKIIICTLAAMASVFVQAQSTNAPGIRDLNNTSGVYTTRLLWNLASSLNTNRVFYTNAGSYYGNTNTAQLNIRTNGSGRWEWRYGATVVATNTANRQYGIWKSNTVAAGTHGYTRYEPTTQNPVYTDSLGAVFGQLLSSRTVYVAKNGSANFPGTMLYPKLAISNGVDAAVAGDTVKVATGVYHENNFQKDQINLQGDIGADVVYLQTTTNDAGKGLLDDRGAGAIRMRLDWPGRMILMSLTNVVAFAPPEELGILTYNPNTSGVIVTTNIGSQISGRIGELSGGNFLSSQFFILNQIRGSNQVLHIDRMVDVFRGQRLELYPAEPGEITAEPSVNGWFVGDTVRYGELHCPYMDVTAQSWYWLEPSNTAKTNDFYFYGGYIHGNMYGVTLTDKYKGWAKGIELDGTTYSVAIGCYGGGVWYFDFDKILGQSILNTEPASGGTVTNSEVYVNSMKWQATGKFLDVKAGTCIVRVDNWIGGTAPAITTAGNGLVIPHHSVSIRTNVSASATSLAIRLPTKMADTNYTPSVSFAFSSGTTNVWYSNLTPTNFVANFAPIVGGGQVHARAQLNAR